MAYFTNTRRGEIPELQEELNSIKFEQKREAIKKTIAAMTVGKDVSPLFPHMVKCMETQSVEIKKLVYLYIINYAKTQPDLAIMAVNSFRKDSRNPTSPLVRALAVRTMGYIRVDKITEYLTEPLKDALQDQDPYVRKTAAICVGKLYDIAPELVEDTEFLQVLTAGLSDGNAMVISNTVASIAEISEARGSGIIPLNGQVVNRILSAMNECTEWGQVFILDYIAEYSPANSKEAETIIERVVPRLAHANPAVVTSAVKVIIKYLDYVSATDFTRSCVLKLAPSLVSLVNSEPEIQYVALRCINLVVQKRPSVLEKEIRVFFCKFNDPVYVKLEKLEIIVRLVDTKNIDQVLYELKDYSTEIDIDFVRKAIQTIGRCAIKLEKAVEKCVQALLDIVELKVSYAVQEILVVIKDIFRKYPNRFEMIIKDIFPSIEELTDPEAKSSLIWILGEYAERIDDADSHLQGFVEGFKDEQVQVQLQILTATVKLFLKRPDDSEAMITNLLKMATEENPNPDIRDRAYIYWRLLSIDPEATKNVVLCEKPLISEDSYILEPQVLDKLIEQMGTLASIYHKPYETKASKAKELEKKEAAKEEVELEMPAAEVKAQMPNLIDDLIGIEPSVESPAGGKKAQVPMQVVLSKDTPGTNGQTGLQIEMAFQREEGIMLECRFTNFTSAPISDFAMKFNTNYFGLDLADNINVQTIYPESPIYTKTKILPSQNSSSQPPSVPFIVQMAIKCNLDIFYFQTPCMFTTLVSEAGKMDYETYQKVWENIPGSQEFAHTISPVHQDYASEQAINSRLSANNIFFVCNKEVPEHASCFSCLAVSGESVLAELSLEAGSVNISCKTSNESLAPIFIQAVNFLLSTNH